MNSYWKNITISISRKPCFFYRILYKKSFLNIFSLLVYSLIFLLMKSMISESRKKLTERSLLPKDIENHPQTGGFFIFQRKITIKKAPGKPRANTLARKSARDQSKGGPIRIRMQNSMCCDRDTLANMTIKAPDPKHNRLL